MKVYIEKEDKELDLVFEGKVSSLLKKLDVNPNSVIVVKEGEVVSEDTMVENSIDLRILSVISGG